MPFTTQEFSGRVFNSLEELAAAKREQEAVRRELNKSTTVTVEKIESAPEDD